MFKILINYNYSDTPLSCGNMIESAMRRRDDLQVYRFGEISPDNVDLVFNTEAKYPRPHGKLTAWWDIEACSYRVNDEFNSDIVLAPYTYALNEYPTNKTYFFPFANSPEFSYQKCDYEYDLMFIGREDINRNARVDLLNWLQSQDIKFFRGNGFPRGSEVSEQLSRSKILLQRSGDAGGVMETRFFEIGPINVLAADLHDGNRDDMNWAAIPDYHYISYSSYDELLEKVKHYSSNDMDRLLMLNRSRENYKKNHTYDVRVRQLLELVGYLKGPGLDKLHDKRKAWSDWQ